MSHPNPQPDDEDIIPSWAEDAEEERERLCEMRQAEMVRAAYTLEDVSKRKLMATLHITIWRVNHLLELYPITKRP
jgi:hypothetical protein